MNQLYVYKRIDSFDSQPTLLKSTACQAAYIRIASNFRAHARHMADAGHVVGAGAHGRREADGWRGTDD